MCTSRTECNCIKADKVGCKSWPRYFFLCLFSWLIECSTKWKAIAGWFSLSFYTKPFENANVDKGYLYFDLYSVRSLSDSMIMIIYYVIHNNTHSRLHSTPKVQRKDTAIGVSRTVVYLLTWCLGPNSSLMAICQSLTGGNWLYLIVNNKMSQLGRWPKGSQFDILAFRNSLELNQT